MACEAGHKLLTYDTGGTQDADFNRPHRLKIARLASLCGIKLMMAVSLQGRAADDLRYIRRAMERSSTFTAVPGRGGVAMGSVGVAAAIVGALQPSAGRWLVTWLTAAAIALVIGLVAMRRKAASAGMALTGASARRFALSLSAPLAAGAALTGGLVAAGNWSLMPPVWLLLYGTGVVTGGVVSVPIVLVVGVCFMLLGVIAMVTPPAWGNVWLGIGFGLFHIGFGLYIARKHGG
jgi:hypothetical protein